MVVPIRDIRNKFTSFSPNMTPIQSFTLPTVFQADNTGMDILKGSSPNNYNEVRGRSLLANTNISRDSSMSSMKLSVVYHEKMKYNNAMNVNINMNDFSPELSYKISQEKAFQVSKVAEHPTNTRDQQGSPMPSKPNPQCVSAEHTYSISTHGHTVCNEDDMVINIQIPYNPNALMESKL